MYRLGLALLLAGTASAAPAAEPSRAVSMTPLHELVSSDDYPAAALRRDEQGTVAFRLDIGTAGEVRSCSVIQSSGSPALDEVSCRIMTERARFTPARDEKGKPVEDQAVSRIRWVLPEDVPGDPRLNAVTALWIACIQGHAAKLAVSDIPAERIPDGAMQSCREIEPLIEAEMKRAALPGMDNAEAMEDLKRQFRSIIVDNVNASREVLQSPPP